MLAQIRSRSERGEATPADVTWLLEQFLLPTQSTRHILASELDPEDLSFYLVQDGVGRLSVLYGNESVSARRVLNLEVLLGFALPGIEPSFEPLRQLLERLETLAKLEAATRPPLTLEDPLEVSRLEDKIMEHVEEVLRSKTDWRLMAEQKSALFSLIGTSRP